MKSNSIAIMLLTLSAPWLYFYLVNKVMTDEIKKYVIKDVINTFAVSSVGLNRCFTHVLATAELTRHLC